MIEALIGGERDPAVLADLAQRTLRRKIPDLTMALAGRFGEHHGVLSRLHLDHIDHINAMIARLDARIEELTVPFVDDKRRLMSIPGIGERAAQAIIGEIGVDMTRFPTAAHLASWAGLCPGNHESAGKRKTGKTRHGNAMLCTVLVEAAWATAHTNSRLGARLRRLHRRMGKAAGPKAAVAVAHTILTIVWHLLAHGGTYDDLGADYYTRREQDPEILAATLKRKIEALGYTVELRDRGIENRYPRSVG
jgi:transposase